MSGSKDLEKLKLYCSNPEKTERMVKKEKYAIDNTKIENFDSGRILVDKDLAEEEEKKMESIFNSI